MPVLTARFGSIVKIDVKKDDYMAMIEFYKPGSVMRVLDEKKQKK